MISIQTADALLRDVYLNVVADQLNQRTNPFYTAIEKTCVGIQGNTAAIPVLNGINGGISCSAETGSLPLATNGTYKTFYAKMANLFGVLEISDKALRVGRSSENAMISLLETEMGVLLDSCKFNFARMLWQNGKGILTTVGTQAANQAQNKCVVTSVRNLKPGMVIDIVAASGGTIVASGCIINDVNASTNTLTFKSALGTDVTLTSGDYITIQNSYNNEILGIPYIYDNTLSDYYGNVRSTMNSLKPNTKALNGSLTLNAIQQLLDTVEEASNTGANMLISGFETRRAYVSLLTSNRTNIDYMNLDGGFKALSYNGIPFVADKYCTETDTLHAVNTDGYKLVQLCDWEWLESDNGRILSQLDDKAAYNATLVKYANLVCFNPKSQGKLTDIA